MGGTCRLDYKGGEKMSFGENLTRLLDERGVRRMDVAAAVGVTKAAITQFTNGETIPSLYTAGRIAAFFNVTLDEMMK